MPKLTITAIRYGRAYVRTDPIKEKLCFLKETYLHFFIIYLLFLHVEVIGMF